MLPELPFPRTWGGIQLNLPRLRGKVLLTKCKQENSLLQDQDVGGFQ